MAASKNSMVDFFFKDFIVANIKALGHITALAALFGAICSTVGWVLGSDGMSISAELYDSFSYSYALPVDAMAAFMGMLGLEFVGGFIADFFSWSVTAGEVSGYNLESVDSSGLGVCASCNYFGSTVCCLGFLPLLLWDFKFFI